MHQLRAQQLDLIYYQSGTLYDIIPHAPRSSTDPQRPNPRPHANSVVGSTSSVSSDQLSGQLSQMTIATKPASTVPEPQTLSTHTRTSEVNSVQSTQLKNP